MPKFSFPTNSLEAINIIINSTFQPFDDTDHDLFAGVAFRDPMITYEHAEEDGGFIVVKDGSDFEFSDLNDRHAHYTFMAVLR